jgi:S-DNA-T family DNA segregation ATPase FtsK/SpoIIIE
MAMAIVSVTSMKANHESFTSILPTLIMSGSMACTMMLWPIMTRIYEKRKHKKKASIQQRQYLSYLENMRKEIKAYQQKECHSRASRYEDTQDALRMLNQAPWKLHNRLPNDHNFLHITIGKGDVMQTFIFTVM